MFIALWALDDHQRRLAGRITTRRWAYAYKAGMSAREAAKDTLVFVSLLGFAFFWEAARILRSRNLIQRNVHVIYGGWLQVGMIPIPNSRRLGTVTMQEIGEIEPQYVVHVEPAYEAMSMDSMAFLAEVQDMVPEFEPLCTADLRHEELKRVLKDGEEGFCAVCREDMETDDVVVVLECGHWFCVGCMEAWLGGMHLTCPLCRGEVRVSFVGPELPHYYDGDEDFDYDADDEMETDGE